MTKRRKFKKIVKYIKERREIKNISHFDILTTGDEIILTHKDSPKLIGDEYVYDSLRIRY